MCGCAASCSPTHVHTIPNIWYTSDTDYLKLHTDEYDAQLKQVENINWLPWVGADYPSAEKKILALGLSYAGFDGPMHAEQGKPVDYTRGWDAERIEKFVNKKTDCRFKVPRNIETMLLGRGVLSCGAYGEIPNEEIIGLWRRMVTPTIRDSDGTVFSADMLTNAVGTYTITYRAPMDASGNEAEPVTRMVQVG